VSTLDRTPDGGTGSPAPRLGRRRGLVVAAAVGVVLAAAVLGVVVALDRDVSGGVGAAVAVLLAGAVAALATSLPGKTPEGLLLGLAVPFAAMMTWTRLNEPIYVWAVSGALGLVALVWTFPWWRDAWTVPRLGGFWLAVPIWATGVVAALLTGSWTVAAQRTVYGGLAVLVVLLVFQARRLRGRDISTGFVAGLLYCHAAILVAGAPYLFLATHYAPRTAWGRSLEGRFWGGPLLTYHPNYIALTAVIVALRVGPDARFARWQRVASLLLAGFFIVLTDSRTAALVAGVGSLAWAVLLLWRTEEVRRRPLAALSTPASRTVVAQALLPLVLLVAVVGISGGSDFLLKNRYAADQATTTTTEEGEEAEEEQSRVSAASVSSGRTAIWSLVVREWRSDSLPEKVFGTADNSRGYLLRYPDTPAYSWQPKLTADNAPLGALRRGGVLGVLVFLVGAALVLWRAFRRDAPLWVPVATLAMFGSILTEDEVLGTTPAWIILFAAEVLVLAPIAARRAGNREPESSPATS